MMYPFHERPMQKARVRSKYSGFNTPYRYTGTGHKGGWQIRFGPSGFLIAEGPGLSTAQGMALFRHLEDSWLLRKKSKRGNKNDPST